MKKFSLIMISLLVLMSIYDCVTSYIILTKKGLDFEMNPIMQYGMYYYGTLNVLIIAKCISLSLLIITTIMIWKEKHLSKRETILSYLLYIVPVCFYAFILYNYNYKFIQLITNGL